MTRKKLWKHVYEELGGVSGNTSAATVTRKHYERCGVVWCGVVGCGVVWYGVVWGGVVWCGVLFFVLYGGGVVCSGLKCCEVVLIGLKCCEVVWSGVECCGVV